MYEALLEFPEVWGGVRKNPFCGRGMDIFWNYTINNGNKQQSKSLEHFVKKTQIKHILALNFLSVALFTC